MPKRLAASWVRAARVVLLRAVVGEWDAAGGEREDHCLLQTVVVVREVIEEARIVVVVDEDAECVDVLEVIGFVVVLSSDLIHGLVAAKHVLDGVVHRIVEKCGDVVLVRTDVGSIPVKAFTHLEYAG